MSDHTPIPSTTISFAPLPCSAHLPPCSRRIISGFTSKAAWTLPRRQTRYLSRIGNVPDPEAMVRERSDVVRLWIEELDGVCDGRAAAASAGDLTVALVKSLRNVREDRSNIAAL